MKIIPESTAISWDHAGWIIEFEIVELQNKCVCSLVLSEFSGYRSFAVA